MKSFVIFALLVAGINALPPQDAVQDLANVDFKNARIVTDAILSLIEDITVQIREAGYDPLHIPKDHDRFALPVPAILNAEGTVEELLVVGVSDIIVHHINYAIFASRLDLILSLPYIEATVKSADAEVNFFNANIKGHISGKFSIKNIRVPATVFVNVGIISGIGVRDINLDITIEDITSELNIVLQGTDYSAPINTFLGQTVINTFNEFRSEINELIAFYAVDIVNDIL